jgi:uncharacterized protein involved in response to NO
MRIADISEPGPRRSDLFGQGFRPFFLAAGLWAAIALTLWICLLTEGRSLPSRFDPITWHIHEMLFGFVMAAIAGFLLTAIPNWTRRLPISGAPLAGLAALWLVGRITCLISALLPPVIDVAADLAFPVVLLAVASREIIAGRNWRNLAMTAPVTVLGIANLLMHLETLGVNVPANIGWRLGLAAVIVLVSAVAGRIVPSFTRNWLVKQHATDLPGPHGRVDRVALGSLHLSIIAWAIIPDVKLVGIALLIAAALNAWRMIRWHGAATLAEPLLSILHFGYLWLVFGTALLGFATLDWNVPLSAAIHALTVGAISTMILAVMTRATRGHSGYDLVADRMTILIYALINAAAIIRIMAALDIGPLMPLLLASASLWVAAFILFTWHYGRMLLGIPPR